MLATLASDALIDAAYRWLCRARRHWPAGSDIWDLRFHWPTEKGRIQAELRSGAYQFEPQRRICKPGGDTLHLWSTRDALVLKALTALLQTHLPLSAQCTHLKGHGGAKGAVRVVAAALADHGLVLRTDVKGYYESIDQHRLLDLVARHIKDRGVLNLVWQTLRRTVTGGALYRDCTRGLARGSPLSPLLGALFLYELDQDMEREGSRLY